MTYTRDIFDNSCRLFFFRLHEIVDLVIQIFDVNVKLIKMTKMLLTA